jgi:hypothetical protein
MATKAERFRSDTERSAATTAKKKKRADPSARHLPSQGRKAVYALEETAPAGTPSRKSTRKGKHRQKAATALTGKHLLVQTAPHSQHDRGRRAPRSRSAL